MTEKEYLEDYLRFLENIRQKMDFNDGSSNSAISVEFTYKELFALTAILNKEKLEILNKYAKTI